MDWRSEINDAVASFVTVAQLAGDPIAAHELIVEFHDAPHRQPSRLPAGRIAIYGFWVDGEWLKIGMAGPKSGPRYVSHHYHMKAPSTLASADSTFSARARVRE